MSAAVDSGQTYAPQPAPPEGCGIAKVGGLRSFYACQRLQAFCQAAWEVGLKRRGQRPCRPIEVQHWFCWTMTIIVPLVLTPSTSFVST